MQKHTLSVLFASAIFSRAAATLGFAVAVLLIKDMLGDSRFAGLSTVAVTIGTAASAAILSKYMNRRGRRPGLVAGYATATVGGFIALAGAQNDSLTGFLLGLILLGVGSGASNLARYAAADLAPADSRGKAISLVVFASTIGAVAGPTLVGVADTVGQSFGLDEKIGPYGLTAIFMAIAGLIIWVALRPDPLVLSGGLDTPDTPKRAGFTQSLRVISARPTATLALGSLVISQAVMVGVMAMTPLHMDAHGHSLSVIGWVISAHTAGMFAFAPLAGWAGDRYGQVPAIGLGGALLVAATAMTAMAGEAPNLLMFPGLYLLGLGWSFGMVAGSALLTDSVPSEDRVSVQGSADLLTATVSGGAALVSGFVFDMAGFHILSAIGLIASGMLVISSATHGRRVTLAGTES